MSAMPTLDPAVLRAVPPFPSDNGDVAHPAPAGQTPAHPAVETGAPRPASGFRIFAIALVGLAAFAGLGFLGLQHRSREKADRDAAVASGASANKPRVLTIKAEKAPAIVEQVLPGSAMAFRETAIYARTSGYLREKERKVDIGDAVKEGQLLAVIETPELDAQLLQSKAALAESKATWERNRASDALAGINLARTKDVVRRNAAAQQDLDEAEAAQRVSTATVNLSLATIRANEAAVRRLEVLQEFEKVTVPFDGVVTARNFDSGSLILADNAASKELFHVADIRTLRVFADVPQSFATAIRPGQAAPVFRREVPGEQFEGTVARTTSSIDPQTRTLRVEVDVPNPKRALLPGMYLQVRFKLEAVERVIRVPGAAVIVRAEGTKVALLDAAGTVRYRPVRVGRDFGQTVEILEGLSGGETLIVRPGDDMPEGTAVEAVSETKK